MILGYPIELVTRMAQVSALLVFCVSLTLQFRRLISTRADQYDGMRAAFFIFKIFLILHIAQWIFLPGVMWTLLSAIVLQMAGWIGVLTHLGFDFNFNRRR